MEFVNMCRLCLAENLELFNILDLSENPSYNFSDIVQLIAPGTIDKDDLLSKNICSTCRDYCNDFLKFRDTVISSNEYQNLFLKKKNEVEELEVIVVEELAEDEMINEEIKLLSNAAEDLCSIREATTEDEDNSDITAEALEDDAIEMLETKNEGNEYEPYAIKEIISCASCNKGFRSKFRLQEHLKTHSTKSRLFKCQTCGRKFTTEILLTRHEVVHSNLIIQIKLEDKRRCIVCGEAFESKSELEDHMREYKLRMENEIIECKHCRKPYTKLVNLVRHLKTHDENKTHLCSICNKTFAMGQDLVDHLNRHKGHTLGYMPYTCDICNKSYMEMSKLKNHVKTHSDQKEFLCTECGKSFNRNSNLRQHLLRHTGVKRFNCVQCPAKFVSKGNLKAHMSVHTMKKPFACETCGSSFTQSYSLVKHNRIHSGERPFQCEFCNMQFYSSDHLKRHIRTHTGEKPYKCEFCSKSFAQNGDLNKHKRLHVGENTYNCTEAGCDEAFRLQTELRNHMKVHFLSKNAELEIR